ncbi:sensor histidine kinase [Novipirellula artificiosorum]|uniref:histidine kinase n=1 Tax=Novipirellula artificiosorum TaxID=2528016 RepID=A0A5C6DBW0_9BACT|nr:ATP-binding protein [Novipirellula artificiosorum]TWU34198.1 Sensor histidine kinase LiaS [Novipirellula artificiosorum]
MGESSRSPSALSDQLTQLIETERAAIGHEIHDSLLPLLFAASAGLHRLLDTAAKDLPAESKELHDHKRLAQVADWIDEAMQTGRQILNAAYPVELDRSSWSDAARGTIDRVIDDPSGQRPAIDWQIDHRSTQLPMAVATTAYRISVEAIRNALRHGKATKITVAASKRGNEFSLAITDNGVGFAPDEVPADRYGVRTMKSRSHLIGGSVKIDSKPGGPTTVEFTIDLAGEPCATREAEPRGQVS